MTLIVRIYDGIQSYTRQFDEDEILDAIVAKLTIENGHNCVKQYTGIEVESVKND